jgi:hypothetical protein
MQPTLGCMLLKILIDIGPHIKISEGGFNRVLIAIMEDGFQAVVGIPYLSIVLRI